MNTLKQDALKMAKDNDGKAKPGEASKFLKEMKKVKNGTLAKKASLQFMAGAAASKFNKKARNASASIAGKAKKFKSKALKTGAAVGAVGAGTMAMSPKKEDTKKSP